MRLIGSEYERLLFSGSEVLGMDSFKENVLYKGFIFFFIDNIFKVEDRWKIKEVRVDKEKMDISELILSKVIDLGM